MLKQEKKLVFIIVLIDVKIKHMFPLLNRWLTVAAHHLAVRVEGPGSALAAGPPLAVAVAHGPVDQGPAHGGHQGSTRPRPAQRRAQVCLAQVERVHVRELVTQLGETSHLNENIDCCIRDRSYIARGDKRDL